MMTAEETHDLKTKAKAEAFDLLVEARRKVVDAAREWTSGGPNGIVAGLESFSDLTREFATLAESLCDKAIGDTLVTAFEEFWNESHGDRAPDSVMVLRYPRNAGKSWSSHS
ncbi:hypothetical protein U8Q02_39950 (plasmid) [Rhizobium leguminosarum]|nr:hypothetical protein U8Q02_39950 [Rhizobium leguminosarum]